MKRTLLLMSIAGLLAMPVMNGEGKILICHIPPGNPGNAHEIVVGDSALPAHLSHGDSEGSCGGLTPTEG